MVLYRTVWANKNAADQLSRLNASDVDFLQGNTAGKWCIYPPHGRRNASETGGLSASRSDTRSGVLLRADLPADFLIGDKLPEFVRIGGERYHQLLLFESSEADWSESWVVHDDGNPEDGGHVILCPRQTPGSDATELDAFDVEDAHCEDIDEMQADGSIVSGCSSICKSARPKVLAKRQRAGIWRLCGIAQLKRPAPLWGYFFDWHDLTLRSVVYALRLAESDECADYALSALWATNTLYKAIMDYYDCYDLVDGHVRAINGNAVLYSSLDVAKAAYLVQVICRCLQAVEADDKEIDRSIAARIAAPIVQGWLLPIPTDSDADVDFPSEMPHNAAAEVSDVTYVDTVCGRIRVRHDEEVEEKEPEHDVVVTLSAFL